LSVKLRLTRMGRKKRPYYRIVALDSRKRRDGAYIEAIGSYNPLTHPPTTELNSEAALKWLNDGAQPSDTVRTLLSRAGILLAWDLQKRGASAEDVAAKVAEHQTRHTAQDDAIVSERLAAEDKLRKDAEDKARKEIAAAKAAEDAKAAEEAKAAADAKAAAEAPAEEASDAPEAPAEA
jgi:small subunit ribosomal protein S16